ncbi:unnamed protein product [Mytilus coruscus]|uniref:Ig-like domain-containing protein n=1 Tax=Mytilus coruscus TaxID=42192 RepID=A0A6J8A5A1_MYTCO|nr:unnamed protein product [Mytilus coruscus]
MMMMIKYHTVVQPISLDVTISGQKYIEPGALYNVTCTVNEYRDNRKTTFLAIIPGKQFEEIIVWYYKLYGCFKFLVPTSTDCRNASCACDDNGLATHWIYTSPSDLSTSVTFQCESSDKDNKIVESTELAPTMTEGPGSSLRFNPTNDTVIKELGQQFVVLCLANCTPVCQFHWEKDNSVVSPGATLQISNLSKEDNGTYTCTGYNGYGTPATKPLYLTVNYGPKAVKLFPPRTEYTVEEEATIQAINCTSDCRPSCEYMWSGPNTPSDTTNVLSLNNIKKNQTGVYNCTACNEVGCLVSSDVNVDVQFGAGSSLQFQPSNTSVSTTKGDPLGPINCIAICNPPCQYIWTKPDKTTINGSQLKLKSLTMEDHGQFICTASNDIGGGQNKSLDVTVNYGPQSVTLLPNKTQYTETEGSDIAPINCTSNCRPICNYTWSGPNVPAGTNNVLSLKNINAHHMGIFICVAYNDLGSLNSSAVNVNIQFGPGSSLQFKPNATSVTKTKGDSLGPIECIATCNPPCQYKWSYHDETKNNGVLTVGNLSIDDHGLFLCTASNGFGDSQNKSLHVTVNYGPEAVVLSPSTKLYTVTHGENVAPINCTSKCRPECTYIWSGPHVPSDTTNVLSLESIKKNQSGDFNCTATNVVGSMHSSVNVIVQYEPVVNNVSINGSSFTVRENTTVILSCKFEGNPAPQNTWEKNNVIISPVQENNGLSMYTIQPALCEDNGNYSCVSNNSLGMSYAQQSLYVTCSPRLNFQVDQPNTKIGLPKGADLSLTVYLLAYPKPTSYVWIFNDTNGNKSKIASNLNTYESFKHVTELSKENLTQYDFGDYILKVDNTYGSTSQTYHVVPQGPPDATTILNVTCDVNTAILFWRISFNGGETQHFSIFIHKKGNEMYIYDTGITDGNDEDVKYARMKLSAGEYMFTVYGKNNYGHNNSTESKPCRVEEVRTTNTDSVFSPAVGGGTAAAIVVIVAIMLFVFIIKRRRSKGDDGRQNLTNEDKDDDDGLKANPLYVSSGETANDSGPLYSVVNKKVKSEETDKTGNLDQGPVYSQVNKMEQKGWFNFILLSSENKCRKEEYKETSKSRYVT